MADMARAIVRRMIGLSGLESHERDIDAPCPSRDFEPGDPDGDCETDGHYMCRECAHADPAVIAEREEEHRRG